jgi:hypothetical protein
MPLIRLKKLRCLRAWIKADRPLGREVCRPIGEQYFGFLARVGPTYIRPSVAQGPMYVSSLQVE